MDGKIGIVAARPSVGDTVAGEQGVVLDPQGAPQYFPIVVVDTVGEVYNQSGLVAREGVLVDSHTRRGSELCPYAVVGQRHFIITRHGLLCVVREP